MNRLPGQVSAVQSSGSISHVAVQVGEFACTATLVGAAAPAPGSRVTLLLPETEVSLAKNLSGMISMRNRLPCTVRAIERGELLSRIVLDCAGHGIAAVITSASCVRMGLAAGDQLEALVKANEMGLAPV